MLIDTTTTRQCTSAISSTNHDKCHGKLPHMIPAADRTQSIETIIIIFLSKDAATVRSHTPRPQAQRTKVRTEVTKITGHKKQEQETNGMDKNKNELQGNEATMLVV